MDVTDRDDAADTFSRERRSFDAVSAGEAVKAPQDGFVVFPNPHADVGQEWFYFAQRRA